jgi:sugar O-acyltransferase (sialic acid O-acetyltransferase NeuD family)
MTRKRIVILGAGGMAREVEWLIRDINAVHSEYDFLGYVVSDLKQTGRHDSREALLGDYCWLEAQRSSIDAVTVGIGTPVTRLKVWQEVSELLPNTEWPSLVHPSVLYDRSSARIAPGVLICAGAVATVNITLGLVALCNFGCTVGHEAVIGAGSTVNPGANISGGVVLGAGVLVGTGAQILQYCKVGDGATVGAGAVVHRDVAAGAKVVGIPAREAPTLIPAAEA